MALRQPLFLADIGIGSSAGIGFSAGAPSRRSHKSLILMRQNSDTCRFPNTALRAG